MPYPPLGIPAVTRTRDFVYYSPSRNNLREQNAVQNVFRRDVSQYRTLASKFRRKPTSDVRVPVAVCASDNCARQFYEFWRTDLESSVRAFICYTLLIVSAEIATPLIRKSEYRVSKSFVVGDITERFIAPFQYPIIYSAYHQRFLTPLDVPIMFLQTDKLV